MRCTWEKSKTRSTEQPCILHEFHLKKKYNRKIKVLKYWTSDDHKFLWMVKSTCLRKKNHIYLYLKLRLMYRDTFFLSNRGWMMNKWQEMQLRRNNCYSVVIQISIHWSVVIYHIKITVTCKYDFHPLVYIILFYYSNNSATQVQGGHFSVNIRFF